MSKQASHSNSLSLLIADCWRRAEVPADIRRIAILALLSLGVGLLFNTVLMEPAASGQPDKPVGFNTVTMRQAYQLSDHGEALLVDTQEPEFYQEQHIKGARNLPGIEFDEYYPAFAAKVSQNQSLILYCELGCMSKDGVAEELSAKGYQDIKLMEEGVEEWKAAGYPLARGTWTE